MSKLREAVRDFIGVKAPNTTRAYEHALRVLADYFKEPLWSFGFQAKFKALDSRDAMGFIYWLRARRVPDGTPTGDNTVRQRIALLRGLYRHLAAVGILGGNPWDVVAAAMPYRQKKQKRPTKLIEFKKVAAILDLPNPRTKKGIRDRALLALMFGGGLRRGELFSLNVDDVAVTPTGVPFLILRDAKAGVDQQQSLPEWAWEPFSVLVSQRKSEGAFEGDPLFPFYYDDGRTRGRLSGETIRRIYREHCRLGGISGAAPHSARVTYASYLRFLGYDERAVADALRHKTIDMVMTYDKRARGPESNPGRQMDRFAV